MNANDMMKLVRAAEMRILERVSDEVGKELELISSQTGLRVEGLSFVVTDVSSFDTEGQKAILSTCNIDVRLPDEH